MNKTVTINLAGISFHIDENAYGKLSRYLNAIRNSLKSTEGSEEIMQDIEARIAELFSEKISFQAQVITLKELDEVIAVMGQPEDYRIDDDTYGEAPPGQESYAHTSSPRSKQLFRDVDNKYVGGVSSGIAHYLGIDPIWIRLIWVLLVLAGLGSPILVYILLWILIPPALTTSDKLKMMGEPINISNIEKKFREGFDTVADRVKNVDYDKFGNKVQKGVSGFFDKLGDVLVSLFNVFAKLIGIVIIIVSLSTLVGLIIGFFTVGSMDFWGNNELTEYVSMVDSTKVPLWLWGLLGLIAIGIPFFALFILGLKLLVDNLKSMRPSVKIVLVIVWALSIFTLITLAIKQATDTAYSGNSIEERTLNLDATDTLQLVMRSDSQFDYRLGRKSGLEIKYTKDNQRVIFSRNIRINLASDNQPGGKIIIEKSAEGNTLLDAKERAEKINYGLNLHAGVLELDGFFITDAENRFRNQEVDLTILVTDSTLIYADRNVSSYMGYRSALQLAADPRPHYYLISGTTAKCLDCPLPARGEEVQTPKAPGDSLQQSKTWEQEVNDQFKGW